MSISVSVKKELHLQNRWKVKTDGRTG